MIYFRYGEDKLRLDTRPLSESIRLIEQYLKDYGGSIVFEVDGKAIQQNEINWKTFLIDTIEDVAV